MTVNTNVSFLELIPEAQPKPKVPKVWYAGREKIATYKFQRLPTLIDLEQMTSESKLWSIWQENDTLIVTVGVVRQNRNHLICVNDHFIRLTFNDSWLSFQSGKSSYTVIGKSDYAIAETAAFLWSLDIIEECSYICGCKSFDFSVVSLDQLSLFFQPHPTRINISLSNISPRQSVFLTQFQHPISLHFFANFSSLNCFSALNRFSDGGKAFVESLLQRDSPFGDLCLEASDTEMFHRLLQVKAINTLEVKCPDHMRDSLPIFSAAAKRLKFYCSEVQMKTTMDWSTVKLPKELDLSFACHEEAHSHIVCAFLRRMAELKDVVKLELHLLNAGLVRGELTTALIQAVDANQSLVEIILHNDFFCRSQWKEMLETMKRHKSFRRFIVPSCPKRLDPDYSMLKRLLKRNRHIDFLRDNGPRNDDEVNWLYGDGFFIQMCQRDLQHEPVSLLPSLVGEILTQSASNDFRRSALVMATHGGALCALVQYAS
ncbi:hypothetical protein FisN_33Lh018 [Fistulifera solaris]|uniref:Uncharacterized protein n=1 Tax=Fistulifera solaris TaxID=1519565 RepID=A0A1Z5KA41_FISSO|nr:hypothetical protein FisN_33Lh018 [Fistulifera solaris]|eukprot:GAX23129.1 hypothetical protein FisN_33Lh018 [Fistulifera solaris]